MDVLSPPEGGRAKNLFILGTSLVTMLELGPDHKSCRGNIPKSMSKSLARSFWRGERAHEFVSVVGKPKYT